MHWQGMKMTPKIRGNGDLGLLRLVAFPGSKSCYAYTLNPQPSFLTSVLAPFFFDGERRDGSLTAGHGFTNSRLMNCTNTEGILPPSYIQSLSTWRLGGQYVHRFVWKLT